MANEKQVYYNYNLVAPDIDEIVDDGIILYMDRILAAFTMPETNHERKYKETDPTVIMSRVSKVPSQDVNLRRINPFSEQGMNNLLPTWWTM